MPVISGGVVAPPGRVLVQEITFTEAAANDAAGSYSGSVEIPAGAFLVDVIVHAVALWDSAGAVDMIVGDSQAVTGDPDGIFIVTDLKATDLTAGQSISAAGSTGTAGGEVGADIISTHWNRRYLAGARTITGKITCAAASGSAGRTRLLVLYTDPTNSAAAAAFTAA